MKKILLSALLVIPFLASCSSGDAMSWNANLIEMYNRTLDDIEDFQELVSLETIGDSITNRHLINAANNALLNVDKGIKQFSEGEIPSDGDSCQKAAVEMLESVREQINIGLKFIEFTEETLEAEVDKYADEYDAASAKTAQRVDAFTVAQKKFADKVGVKTE